MKKISQWPFDSAQGKQEYDPSAIEKKWQGVWTKSGIYKTPSGPKNKKYILDMFPYPSGATMHVGHLEGYVGTDIISRYERMKGRAVLHPMGWDSFGLPAENYAIETGIHPYQSTHKNIETFKRQLNATGLSYDWDREINTSSLEYYKWNQWLFILMFERGLAYKKKSAANWCPSCETVLANEQVVNGQCERCGAQVVQKEIEQWFLKITDYADRLISGLDHIDWLEEVKVQQKNWIGRSGGVMLRFKVKDMDIHFEMFDSVPQTFMAQTFTVIAPEHPMVYEMVKGTEYEKPVMEFIEKMRRKKAANKFKIDKDIEGVFTGRYLEYTPTGKLIPIWVASFVIYEYGSGVVNSSAHDERDFAFAKKYGIPLHPVMFPTDPKEAEKVRNLEYCYHHAPDGILQEPEEFKGRTWGESRDDIVKYIENNGFGTRKIQYHLHDWTISRQRYWGTPIPMVYCESCAKRGDSWFTTDEAKKEAKIRNSKFEIRNSAQWAAGWQPVPLSALPVKLPKDVDFKPTGESPLARSREFQENVICPECGGPARREVDTMDTYFDSSWYFIRFVDSKNRRAFASQKAIKNWLPVDVYVGGGHEVQHLLFARFFWKVLFDAGLIDKSLGDEPFLKLRAPGWILGPDSRKMSKRWNNVITPDDIIPKYGADTLRLYEMFMGPFQAMKPWSITGVNGVHRFIKKIWTLFEETRAEAKQEGDREASVLVNRLVKKVGEDIEKMNFNTAISGMMETYNSLAEMRGRGVRINWPEVWEKFLLVLSPFAPHLAEELWQRLKNNKEKNHQSFVSVHSQSWPAYDPELIQEEEVTIPVQVDGKLRDTLRLNSGQASDKEVVENKARASEKVSKYLVNKKIEKVIFVQGKLINFVMGK